MALTDLLQAIQADADAELATTRQAADEQAAAIVAAAASEAAALERQREADARAEAQAEAGRRLAGARLAAASRVRAAREDAYLRLRERLADELAALREGDDYPTLLAALIDEALVALPDATCVRVDSRDHELAAAYLARVAPNVALEASLEAWGGAEAVSATGRRVVNTLERRLADAEPQLRLVYSRLLTGERQ